MLEIIEENNSCCSPINPQEGQVSKQLLPMYTPPKDDEDVCCGPKPAPPSSPFEKPGYQVCPFVEGFTNTANGPVPRIKSDLDVRDYRGSILVRLGVNRNNYKVAPGLYALGQPNSDSAVLVTANYKLSFDTLRRELTGQDVWILVLDTRGVNVWCAAGKKTFSSREVIRQVQQNHLDRIVSHRKLILPQLSATGVSAQEVKRGCGFAVVWGPIRAGDIKSFLASGMKAEKTMRQVTFHFSERLVLTPVEVVMVLKYLIWIVPLMFLLSGIGPNIFSLMDLWQRGFPASLAVILGVLSGTVLTPVFLPWVPFRAFAVKGAITGLLFGLLLIQTFFKPLFFLSALSLILLTMALSSYLAMNFTGCTPFTSPSGVEKEMRTAIPLQSVAVLVGLILWIVSAFLQPMN